VVTGFGKIDGRKVFVFARTSRCLADHSPGRTRPKLQLPDRAAPIIGLNDSGGARIQEGVESLAGYADIFLRNSRFGMVPQIARCWTVRGGPCTRGHHRLRAHGRADELHVHHRTE